MNAMRLCSAPSIVDANPTSPTSAEVTLNPPANAGPVDSYQVSMCPTTGGSCVTATCKTTVCEVAGLKPGTTYDVTADAIIAGKPVPTSNTAEVTTPPAGAPTLTSADDTSSTTAQATAEPPAPAGVTFTQYTFTATPLDGGAPAVVTSSTPEVTFTGLTPATQVRSACVTVDLAVCILNKVHCAAQCSQLKAPRVSCFALQYEVTVVGTLPDGSNSPVSNTLDFVTPAAG